MNDLNYYRMRAERERQAAERQQHPTARQAHLSMAERYEQLLSNQRTDNP
jgi:hypothetical protein